MYLTTRRLFACLNEPPKENLPQVMEIPVDPFAMQRADCTVPRAEHLIHLGAVTPLNC